MQAVPSSTTWSTTATSWNQRAFPPGAEAAVRAASLPAGWKGRGGRGRGLDWAWRGGLDHLGPQSGYLEENQGFTSSRPTLVPARYLRVAAPRTNPAFLAPN